MLLMNKITKTPQDKLDKLIPVLDKLVRLCDKNDIAMQFTAQIETTDDINNIISEALYTDESHKLFKVINKMVNGKLSLVELPDGDYYLRSLESDGSLSEIQGFPLSVPFTGIIH